MKHYDVLVIGSGPSGYTSSIYSGNCNLNTGFFIGPRKGGLITTTDHVDNVPGFLGTGEELADTWDKHLKKLHPKKVERIYGTVKDIKKKDNVLIVTDYQDNQYSAVIVICASGSKPRKLGVALEKQLEISGKIRYCAVCDARGVAFLGNIDESGMSSLKVCVVGGGNAAIEETIYLTSIFKSVTLIYRKSQLTRPFKNKLLELEALKKEGKVLLKLSRDIHDIHEKSIILKNTDTGTREEMSYDCLFVAIGNSPNSEYLMNLNKNKEILTSNNYLKVNSYFETCVEGLYGAGDILGDEIQSQNLCRHRQVTTATAEGTAAILNAATKYKQKIEILRK